MGLLQGHRGLSGGVIPAPAPVCFPISSVISSRTLLSFGVEGCAEAALCLLPVLRKVRVVTDISVFKFSFHFNK